MNTFYDLAVYFLGDLPLQFTFFYSIFAVIIATLVIGVIFMFFKMVFNLVGLR